MRRGQDGNESGGRAGRATPVSILFCRLRMSLPKGSCCHVLGSFCITSPNRVCMMLSEVLPRPFLASILNSCFLSLPVFHVFQKHIVTGLLSHFLLWAPRHDVIIRIRSQCLKTSPGISYRLLFRSAEAIGRGSQGIAAELGPEGRTGRVLRCASSKAMSVISHVADKVTERTGS